MTAKKNIKTPDKNFSNSKNTRNRSINYPSEVYAARLPLDDARILDDYAKKHHLDRADVVRIGLHQFAIKQQMIGSEKDPTRELLKEIISEQIGSLKTHFDELVTAINSFTKYISGNHRQSFSTATIDDLKGSQQDAIDKESISHSHTSKGESILYLEQLFADQQKTLERILLVATLALRFTINYTVDPVLQNINLEKEDELKTHLRAADLGGDYWSDATSQVVRRTGNRIMLELDFLPEDKEEIDDLMDTKTNYDKTFERGK